MSLVLLTSGHNSRLVSAEVVKRSTTLEPLLEELDNTSAAITSRSEDQQPVIPLPARYQQALDNYYLYASDNNKNITKPNYFVDCWMLWDYLDDPEYQNYLLSVLYNNWSRLWLPITKSTALSEQAYQSLLLNVPIDFIPDSYRYNNAFMRDWLQQSEPNPKQFSTASNHPSPKEVVLDKRFHYYFNVRTEMKFDRDPNNLYLCSYHTDEQGDVVCPSYFYIFRVTDRQQPLANLVSLNENCRYAIELASSNDRVANNSNFYDVWILSKASPSDKRNGLWITNYQDSSTPKTKEYLVNGLRQGYCWDYYDDGRVKLYGYYDHGLKQGEFIRVRFKGYTDHEGYLDDILDGPYKRVEDSTGKALEIGQYSNGLRTGLWQIESDISYGNFTSIGHYQYDRKVGYWNEFEITSKSQDQGTYVNGTREGTWVETNVISGDVSTGDYKAGFQSGLWVTRDRTGQLIAEKDYRDGRRRYMDLMQMMGKVF